MRPLRRGDPPEQGRPEAPLTVGVLTTRLKQLLEGEFFDAWVAGEIVGLKPHSSGHVYFTLKDDYARLGAVIFRSQVRTLAVAPSELADGMQVVCHGRLDLYEPQGSYKLVVDQVQLAGLGALLQRLEELKRKLQAEGLFDESRKLPLPFLPGVIGIVTSPTSAAIQDMLRIIGERFPSHIRLYPALVQGDEAARDIARGIARLDADPEVDVIIVGRGGGAFEDLLPFSDERVVRAVAACATPIVSAVGHEIDFPLCDLAADVRAPTPTAAAQLVVPDRRELQSQLSAWQEELHRAFDRSLSDLEMSVGDAWASLADEIDARMEAAASRVETLRAGLTASHPAHRLERVADRVVALSGSLRFAMEQYLSSRERQVATQRTLVEQLGPQAQLSRGYAVVRRPAAGPVIRAAAQVCPGDPLEVILSEGRLGVRVEERR